MDLARLLAPRTPELAALGRELFAARPDLAKAFGAAESLGFLQWLGVNGVLEDERVAAHFPPLPPETLRSTSCGGPTLHTHLYSGAEDFKVVAELYELYAGRPAQELDAVLDFGCGCGRLLRWFHSYLPDARLVGADVRRATIEWCARNLAGTYLANDTAPPLDLPDDSVDLAVALSVFSHLSLEQNLAWMAELVRVTRPGGLVLVSTHGAFALAVCARSLEHQQSLQLDPAAARTILRSLPIEHFVHYVLPEDTLARADGVADDYGQAFLDETFVNERWGPLAEVAGSVPVALNLFQDVHVLRVR